MALLTNKVDNKNNSVNAPGKNELITKYKFGDSGKKSDRSDRSNEHSDAQDKLNLIPYGKYGTEENDIKNVDPAEGSGN
ncbi:MAG: hypothetical protein H8E13_19145 [Actinobacteria bacterium]|nr:hypothetical protein [Actinomycetota bacterium]